MEALPLPAKRPSLDNGEEVGAPKQLPFLVVFGDYFLVDQHHTRRFAQILSNTGNDFRSVWTACRSAKKILYLGEISALRKDRLSSGGWLFVCDMTLWANNGTPSRSLWMVHLPRSDFVNNNGFAMGRPTVKE